MADTFPAATDDSPEAQIEALKRYAAQLPVDPSLRTLTKGVPDHEAIDAPVPEVRATVTEERFKDLDMDAITHVVIPITLSRQVDVFQYVGYQYDWNYPAPFWCFLGKLVAKGLFDDKTELDNPNYVAIRRREFIGYTTSMWRAALEAEKAGGKDGRPPLNAIEVHFKKPRPGQPLEMIWAPARAMVAAGVGRMKHFSDLRVDEALPEDGQESNQSS